MFSNRKELGDISAFGRYSTNWLKWNMPELQDSESNKIPLK